MYRLVECWVKYILQKNASNLKHWYYSNKLEYPSLTICLWIRLCRVFCDPKYYCLDSLVEILFHNWMNNNVKMITNKIVVYRISIQIKAMSKLMAINVYYRGYGQHFLQMSLHTISHGYFDLSDAEHYSKQKLFYSMPPNWLTLPTY